MATTKIRYPYRIRFYLTRHCVQWATTAKEAKAYAKAFTDQGATGVRIEKVGL